VCFAYVSPFIFPKYVTGIVQRRVHDPGGAPVWAFQFFNALRREKQRNRRQLDGDIASRKKEK
jgi:hypothetical protein